MTIDNRLQHLSNSEGAVVVLFVEACSPLTPLMVAGVVDIKDKLKSSQGFRIETLDTTLEIVSGGFDGACPFQRILHMLAKGHASDDKGLELADEMRRSLLKVALADSVKAYSSERSEPDMLAICIPPIILDQTQLEDFRVVCVNNSTIGLLEIANKILKQPHLHFEPFVLGILFHHLEEGRGFLGNFLCASKVQHRRRLDQIGIVKWMKESITFLPKL